MSEAALAAAGPGSPAAGAATQTNGPRIPARTHREGHQKTNDWRVTVTITVDITPRHQDIRDRDAVIGSWQHGLETSLLGLYAENLSDGWRQLQLWQRLAPLSDSQRLRFLSLMDTAADAGDMDALHDAVEAASGAVSAMLRCAFGGGR